MITHTWKLWMIDFTRAFRAEKELPAPTGLRMISRKLWRGMYQLDRETLERETGSHLTGREIDAVLARRDRILKIFADKIAALGEAEVVFDP